MGTKYKGYEIVKTYRHGEKQLYSRLKDAKAEIDSRERKEGIVA